MRLGEVAAICLLPLLIGLGFCAYGGIAPAAWEEGHPLTRLTTKRFYLSMLVAGMCLSCLSFGWINLFFASRSASPTLTGTITQLQWVRGKNEWLTQFNLRADDGTDHAVVVHRYIPRLQWGDRANVTMRAYDDQVLGFDVLSGYRRGLQLQWEPRGDKAGAGIMTIFALAIAGSAWGVATGRIK